jgi:hypothetical protein
MESSTLIMPLQLKISEIPKTERVGCPLKDDIILQLFWRKCTKKAELAS